MFRFYTIYFLFLTLLVIIIVAFVYCLSELYWTLTYRSEKVLASKSTHVSIENRFAIIEHIKRNTLEKRKTTPTKRVFERHLLRILTFHCNTKIPVERQFNAK